MRIIAGEFRSRRLRPVPGDAVRPTPDRLREALFNVLAPRIAGATFIDAYAGSGAVGLEALSRSAHHVVLIERSEPALAIIRRNVADLEAVSRVAIIPGSAAKVLPRHPADIVFIDPPYHLTTEYERAFTAANLRSGGLLIAQHTSRLILPQPPQHFQQLRVTRQGDNTLTYYECRISTL